MRGCDVIHYHIIYILNTFIQSSTDHSSNCNNKEILYIISHSIYLYLMNNHFPQFDVCLLYYVYTYNIIQQSIHPHNSLSIKYNHPSCYLQLEIFRFINDPNLIDISSLCGWTLNPMPKMWLIGKWMCSHISLLYDRSWWN